MRDKGAEGAGADGAGRPAGLGPRTLAFLIDLFAVGLLALGLGMLCGDTLATLGGWGRAVGFLLGLIYFAPLDSRWGGGRSPGKRLLKLRVAGRGGQPVSLARAALRYTVIGLPAFLNNALIPVPIVLSWAAVPLALVVFGMGGAALYLYFFNRRTGQGLHDLATATYVLAAGRSVPQAALPGIHRLIAGAILLLGLAAPVIAFVLVGSAAPFERMKQAALAAQATGDAVASRLSKGTAYLSGGRKSRYLEITVYLKRWPDDAQAEAVKFAGAVLDSFPDTDVDVIVVVLKQGYDLGFVNSWKTKALSQSPAGWRRTLAGGAK